MCPRFIAEPHSVLGFPTFKGRPGLCPVMGEGVLIPHLEEGSPPTLNCLGPFLPELIPRGQGAVLLGCLVPSGGKRQVWGVNLPPSCLLLDGNTYQAWGFPQCSSLYSYVQSPARGHPRLHKTQFPHFRDGETEAKETLLSKSRVGSPFQNQ